MTKYRKLLQRLFWLVVFALPFFSFFRLANSASSPWTQTDWSGGSGQTSWSDTAKFDSYSGLNASTSGQLTLSNLWYNSNWLYRRKITFDNSSQAANLNDFTVLVILNSSRINYSSTQDSGQDIRFTDSDGTTLLSYEIERWDETGSSYVWVKVPQVDASSSTDYIYMYYGNSGATDGQDPTNAWVSSAKAVYHLKDDPNTSTIQDSTSTGNDGSKLAANEPLEENSKIGKGQYFDGTNDYILTTVSSTEYSTGSAQFWVKDSDPNTDTVFLQLCTSCGTNNSAISIANSGQRFGAWPYNTSGGAGYIQISAADTNSLFNSTWHLVTITFTSSSSSTKVYVDGVSKTVSQLNSYVTNPRINALFRIGSRTDGNNRFSGSMDEIRIYNAELSSSWIAATYKSESDTFNTYSSEESPSAFSGTLTSSIFDSGFAAGSTWGTLTYSATTPSNTSVSIKARSSNSSSMTGATAFSSCSAITSGSDISANSCITDSHRYIQYQATLANTDYVSTSTLQDVSIAFESYDSQAPAISLTALSPDPNNDSTPTLSGSATDSIGTVSSVQFQMDSTSGNWSSCSATDGAYDEATESFTCTPSTSLTDGSHTIYIRATDVYENTTSSGSESTDSFSVDTTTPMSVELIEPADSSYTTNQRPTFKWKATTDATSGLSKYIFEIDSPTQADGTNNDFSIDDIPISGTADYITNKFNVYFSGDHISLNTNSSNEWNSSSSQNDGKVAEGKVTWKVKARDAVGNETSSSRTIFVDRSGPDIELTQINSTAYSSDNFSTSDSTPTITGKIIDRLSGNTLETQDENGPKVASAPKEVNIKIEKKQRLGYELLSLYLINMDNPYYTCDPDKIIDNNKQKCDKYLPFQYTPRENLQAGEYRITIVGTDKAGNSASEKELILHVVPFDKIATNEEKKLLENETEQPTVIEITKPTEEQKESMLTIFFDSANRELTLIKKGISSAVTLSSQFIANGYSELTSRTSGVVKNVLTSIGNKVGNLVKLTKDGINMASSSVKTGAGNLLFFVGEKTNNLSHGLGTAIIKVGYLFIPEPTTIFDVKVEVISSTSAKISWQTNHPANGKINYGLDETYPWDVQTQERTTMHEFTLTDLSPATQYHFEVMSQNRNYVYDANRKFTTPSE